MNIYEFLYFLNSIGYVVTKILNTLIFNNGMTIRKDYSKDKLSLPFTKKNSRIEMQLS